LCITKGGDPGIGELFLIENFYIDPVMSSNQEINCIGGAKIDCFGPVFNVDAGYRTFEKTYLPADYRSFMIRFDRFTGHPFETNEEMAKACMDMLVESATKVQVTQSELDKLKETYLMAKKNQAAAVAATPVLQAATPVPEAPAAAPVVDKPKRTPPPPREAAPPGKVTLLRRADPNKKEDHIPKQAEGVLECLSKNGGSLMEDKLGELLIEGKFIETRQTGNKIYKFYKKDLIGKGLIKVEAV